MRWSINEASSNVDAHFSLMAREAINNLHFRRWRGREGLVTWITRSPDLTPHACQSLSAEEILQATDSVVIRLRKCLHEDRRQFEHLFYVSKDFIVLLCR